MIYDISYPLSPSIQVYKNSEAKKPQFINVANHVANNYYETDLRINLHTGTHVDFPLHMISGGATSDSEQLEPLIGSAKVFNLTEVADGITVEDLKQFDIQAGDFLLFQTKNSFSEEFLVDFTYLTEEAAMYVKEIGVRGVGTDGLGIERSQPGHPTHKTLLSNNIVIIEGLRLMHIKPGEYQMICLPLKIEGVEASLARVILLDD